MIEQLRIIHLEAAVLELLDRIDRMEQQLSQLAKILRRDAVDCERFDQEQRGGAE